MSEQKPEKQRQNLGIYSILRVDMMYYVTARGCIDVANDGWEDVCEEIDKYESLQQRSKELFARREHAARDDQDEEASDDAFEVTREEERVSIDLENQQYRVREAYAPVLENLAVAQLLCANCLEAHINVIGSERLAGKEYDEFDKLSITGKWLFLPKLLGLTGFDVGAEPFQSLRKLVRWRNDLSHYKHKKEVWNGQAVPEFLEKLGLTIPQAEASLKATRAMVLEIQKQLGNEENDYWDHDTTLPYLDFQFTWEDPPKEKQ